MDSSDEELYLLQILLSEELRQEKIKRRKRKWCHEICQKRKEFGEFHTLFKDLLDDEKKFFQYFRMSHEKYCELLEILRQDLQKQTTTFREPIKPEERLAICLR